MFKWNVLLGILVFALAACPDEGSTGADDDDTTEGVTSTPEARPDDGSVLPFAPVPSASTAGTTLATSEHHWREEPSRLEDPPNILIVMLDDAGFGHPGAFGGDIETPALSRLAREGIVYNRFHNTAMCSPTRAALLTGRNHHRVGNGQIAELASDYDGYIGQIPPGAALLPAVLGHYGYRSSAFGKWHNTPPTHVSRMGPFDEWPTGRGFDYFYGFMGGETSQFEPRLYENTTPVEPPHHDPEYHLTSDMADRAITWMRDHEALTPDSPWLLYFAPGAVHGPHQVQREWIDKYRGRFDEGWDAMRERTFARQKEMGFVPEDAELTPRPDTLPAWEDIPEEERAFQLRLMETFAGFVEHTDTQVNRLLDELDTLGVRDETMVIYVWSDNGASAEGQAGTIVELLAQNGIPTTIDQHLAVLNDVHGGLDAIGTAKLENMYHGAWAWAGNTPLLSTKLVAAHFGGTRTPLVISWPGHITPDTTPRSQFHHVNDITPTIYDVLGIPQPEVVEGWPQIPVDGISMQYTFADAGAEGQKETQYFEILGSRGVYQDGFMASVFGPRAPWVVGQPDLAAWDPDEDPWELYDLSSDYSQAHDIASGNEEKVRELRELFAAQAEENHVNPVGGAFHLFLHPEDRREASPGRREWSYSGGRTRIPENFAPRLGSVSTRVTVDAEVPRNASGVLYALCGVAGGITLYMDGGRLFYEFNTLGMWRSKVASTGPIPTGEVQIVVETRVEGRPGTPAEVVVTVGGTEVGRTNVPVTVPIGFSATETLDIGTDLGSPVALEYFDRAPFAFEGDIARVHIQHL